MRIAIVLLVSLISMQAQIPQPTDFDGWKNRGMELIRANQQQEAANAFEHATNLNPSDPSTHFYLGSTYMLMSFGAQSPEKAANAIRAKTEFNRVLALDPENPLAPAALAAMTYQEAKPLQGSEKLSKLQEARDWDKRVILTDPKNKEAYLSLGVIAWTEFYPDFFEARFADGLKLQDPGPLRSAASREKLLSQYGPLIEDGIANLQDAISIDPQYDRAMAFMSLLVSEKADLRDTHDQYTRDMTEATGWTQRELVAKREKLHQPQPATAGSNDDWFEAFTLVLLVPPPPLPMPPPPPPPPLPPGFQLLPGTLTAVPSTIRKTEPQRINISAGEMAGMLIQHTFPVYPPVAKAARISGTVVLQAEISKTGSVEELQVVSGPAMLQQAALDAVKDWRFKPYLLNNEPVEVETTVNVVFTLGR
jgi:TonB family protein